MHETCTRCGLFHAATAPCISFSLNAGDGEGGLQPGRLLAGRYHILRTIHRGGMSTLYLAEDSKLNGREVALKELRLPAEASAQEAREAEAWFARESALLSVIRHPLIPLFYSVFREEGHSYIAQEYVSGENLEDLIKRQGSVDAALVLRWAIALSELLVYLHGMPEPVIFRDLKPANVLVRAPWSTPERLAVVDFGIARTYDQGAVGTVIGTPGYAPPEQYQGLATPQSDIYALGATLHRALTGYDPEQGTPFVFPPVRSLNPLVPLGLAAVVERATALNPADRYASAEEMHRALASLAPAMPGFGRPRARSAFFDSTWMAVAAALIGISILSRMLAFLAVQPGSMDRQWILPSPNSCSGTTAGTLYVLKTGPSNSDNMTFCLPSTTVPSVGPDTGGFTGPPCPTTVGGYAVPTRGCIPRGRGHGDQLGSSQSGSFLPVGSR
jgi:serine/threonine protein kinase